MSADPNRVRGYLRAFEFTKLFIDELGWDRLHSAAIKVPGDERPHLAMPIAEKRGMTVFLCYPGDDGRVLDRQTRQSIDRFLTGTAREHVVIFLDSEKPRQVWQWVKRVAGGAPAYRDTWFHPGANGESLVQKVLSIEFPLDEEEDLSLTRVEERVRKAFDLDKVTKRFYKRFELEREAFLKLVAGLDSDDDRAWYTSVMVNRLMFIYFIQKKQFLDADPDYLRNRLAACVVRWGKDKFHSFYRHFLLRLFHEGLGRPSRTPELDELLGQVPYLNGGLFELHILEDRYPDIQIPDEAFERLFAFFESYEWHLDDRPLRSDNEINPDVLGYIFEKYINQKEQGAYYTGRDITGYISASTLIPFILRRLESECPQAFVHNGIWDLLKTQPETYLFREAMQGIDQPYPDTIAKGILDPRARNDWNSHAPPSVGLPGEIWREVIARRQQHDLFVHELAADKLRSAEALVRWNLDLVRLCVDFVEDSEDPTTVRKLLTILQNLSVLDPTCGSGAFLFSALNVIEELYEACLTRIEAFLAEVEAGQRQIDDDVQSSFRTELTRVSEHPSRKYYVLKSCIISNLFGVDLMEEAAEICKLRLFLKIVAQIDRIEDLEALPDIDFNIRAGNTLVGYTTLGEVRESLTTSSRRQKRLVTEDDEKALARIDDRARMAADAFERFRDVQTRKGIPPEAISQAKRELEKSLSSLETELSRTQAIDYGVDVSDGEAFAMWIAQNHPFHWLVDFYGIMNKGGFDVIVGNPPYLEAREVPYEPRGFSTFGSGAIHAMCVERGVDLLNDQGTISMIVPLALVSTQRMTSVQKILESKRTVLYSNFSWRPGKLFDEVNRALTIFIALPSAENRVYATGYRRWASENRESLIHTISYTEVPRRRPSFWVPKLGTELERDLLKKMLALKQDLGRFKGKGHSGFYHRTTGGLYWKVFTDFAPGFRLNGKAGHSTRETNYPLRNSALVVPAIALLSSDLFWWWYTITSNLRDLNPSDLDGFPVPDAVLTDKELAKLGREYLDDIVAHSTWLTREQKLTGTTQTQSFKVQLSKRFIDNIDRRVAELYKLSEDELEFVINYDIKFRMSDSDVEGNT